MLAEHDGARLGRVSLRIELAVARHHLYLGDPLCEGQGGFHGLSEASLDALLEYQTVDDHLDGVHLVAGQVQVAPLKVSEFVRLAVHDGPAEPLAGQVTQQGVVGALTATDHRSQDLKAGAGVHFEDPVHDLLGGLANEPLSGLWIVWNADPGVQQAQVVVDLGDGSDRRPGVPRSALLVD